MDRHLRVHKIRNGYLLQVSDGSTGDVTYAADAKSLADEIVAVAARGALNVLSKHLPQADAEQGELFTSQEMGHKPTELILKTSTRKETTNV